MEGLEQMLQSVLSDPERLQQIMAMAQSLGLDPGSQEQPQKTAQGPDLQQLAGLIQKTGVDSHQQALLSALMPYMSEGRVEKLRRAMQAAKMAAAASSLLNREKGGSHV